MKKYISILMMALLFAVCVTGCGKDKNAPKETAATAEKEAAEPKEDSEADKQDTPAGKHHVTIEIADYGILEAELDADVAPITVANFVKLAKEGFYDGLTFHRIIARFMIQGGDPAGDGSGGSGENIKGEFAANGVQNSLSHKRGVLSMARSANNYDSASSQFFIVHEDADYLDGEYAAFGTVTAGMDIVDKICQDVVPIDDNGTVPAENQPKITAIKVID